MKPKNPYAGEYGITREELREAAQKFQGKSFVAIPFRHAGVTLRWRAPVGTAQELDERGGFVMDLRDRCDA